MLHGSSAAAPAPGCGPASAGDAALAEAVAACRGDPGFLADLADLLARVDAEAARRHAVCLGGGACCKLDRTEHRLYASAGELALLLSAAPADLGRCSRGRCPYQLGPRCTARARRPLGCRTYFCRAPHAAWGEAAYERHHRRIRMLHEGRGLPYAYVELVPALAALWAGVRAD